jgi:hypothetical protein
VVEHEGQASGFALLCGLDSGNRSIELKRVAVWPPGKGIGREALRQIVERWCIAQSLVACDIADKYKSPIDRSVVPPIILPRPAMASVIAKSWSPCSSNKRWRPRLDF